MFIERKAKSTLTALEMNNGDTLRFQLFNGDHFELELLNTGAEIINTTLNVLGIEEFEGRTTYQFWGEFLINGQKILLKREVGTQKSFYEPWVIDKVNIWFDAVDAIFDFMRETHSPCRLQENCSHALPLRRQARIAIQDASARICPETVYPWCPLPMEGLKIENCYRGEDCWMGAYDGASAHGGLDINHPEGTPLYTPITIDDQFLYNSVEMGHSNNRWRGIRHWTDGSQWILTTCHMTQLTVSEHTPIEGGLQYAEGAGVWVGAVEHSHFAFAVVDYGELIRLDPWILFWQMYQDQIIEKATDE